MKMDGSEEIQAFAYERKGNSAVIRRCFSRDTKAAVPGSIVRVGRYCLYNCDHLRKLTFTGQLADWGTGVFTGCHHICEVVLTTDADMTDFPLLRPTIFTVK